MGYANSLMEWLDELAAMPEPEPAEEWKPEHREPEPAAEDPRAKAEAMKARIMDALKLGQDPGQILFAALDCIGILTGDQAWAAAGREILTRICGGLEQADLFRDDARVVAERLEALADEQRAKTRATLQRAISKAEKIQRDAEKALQAFPMEGGAHE